MSADRTARPATGQEKLRINCMTAYHIASYFTKLRGAGAEKLLEGLPFTMDYLKNGSNWLTDGQSYRFFMNCRAAAPEISHRGWQEIGESISGNGAPGYYKMLFTLMSVEDIMRKMPGYVKSVSKWSDYSIVSAKKGEIIYKMEPVDRAERGAHTVGVECSYHLGILTSIPNVKERFAYQCEGTHEICSTTLPVIMENCYGLKPEEYHYDHLGFHVRGYLAGRWVKLRPLEENGACLGRSRDICSESEADAIAIIRDVSINGATVLKEGEVYDAPYCVFRVRYKKRFFMGERMDSRSMMVFLESQIRLTEEKVRQAMQAKQEAEQSLAEVNKRDEIIRSFTRYSIMDEIYCGGNPLEFQPVRRNLAIMFADIRNFAALTEELDPITITKFLNDYFRAMSVPVREHGGEIDKYIGDGIMAVFPESSDAVRAAIEMSRIVKREAFNFLPGMGLEIKTGAGINYDEIVEGNIGTPETKIDRTIIGDGVNLASRLESLTKFYSSDIILSDLAREELDESVETRYLDLITVKGKTRSVSIYEVLDIQNEATREFKRETSREYRNGVSLYKAGDFASALKVFIELNNRLEHRRMKKSTCSDPIIGIYLQRLIKLIDLSNDRAFMLQWDGVYRHGEK